ncbi:MAG TPA: type II secretion system protein GspC [Kofleriaceae bacterium]|nr:type II secretion system protein GspC [Kofleriaceae bacterium]
MTLPSPRAAASLALALAAALAAVPAASADDDVTGYACSPAPASAKLTVSFRPDVSVAELATWVAGFTCESVVIAPDVAKHATRVQIIAPAPLTPKQAIKLFVASLEAAGLKVKRKDRTFTVTLGPGMPRSCPDVVAAGEEDGSDGAAPEVAIPVDADREADKIAAGIRKVDETHSEVPRAVVDQALANPGVMARGARVLPAVTGGKLDGFKLYAIRPGGAYARIGLVNGDIVVSLNGLGLDNLDRALDAYTALRTATRVDVGILRRGKPMTLTVTITP